MSIDIEQEIVGAVAHVLKKPAHEIEPHVSFQQLGADELDMFELIIRFEDTFMLEITDEDATTLTCVNNVIEYVTRCRNNTNTAAL